MTILHGFGPAHKVLNVPPDSARMTQDFDDAEWLEEWTPAFKVLRCFGPLYGRSSSSPFPLIYRAGYTTLPEAEYGPLAAFRDRCSARAFIEGEMKYLSIYPCAVLTAHRAIWGLHGPQTRVLNDLPTGTVLCEAIYLFPAEEDR